MNREQFDLFVSQIEKGVGRHPSALRWRTAWWAAIGYAGLSSSLVFVLALAALFLVPAFQMPVEEGIVLYIIGATVLVLGGFTVGRPLSISGPAPAGRRVKRAEAPALFNTLDELRRNLHAAPFHRVLIVNDLNAAVHQLPRLGVFGWPRNDLLLGLPVLDCLSPDEFRAVLAHEFVHLSRRHGRFGHWIYRLRRSWSKIFENLRQPRIASVISIRPVLIKYIDWFWPRFNAHAFVLSRANEYEADQIAARLTATPQMAAALVRIAVADCFLKERYWPDLWLTANQNPEPPTEVFSRLNEVFRAGYPAADHQRWTATALQTTTTNADTHPCLTDRLRALGTFAGSANSVVLGPPPSTSAAAALLGPSQAKIREDIEAAWRKLVTPQWHDRHAKARALQDRLVSIDGAVPNPQADVDSLWDKARALIELQGDRAAVPVLQQILQVAPTHGSANFCLGRHLLKLGDSAGETHIERALAADEKLVPDGYRLLHEYYRSTGQAQRLRELDTRIDTLEKTSAESQKERGTITAADQVIPHALGEAALVPLRQLLAADATILTAQLGQKKLQHFTHQRLFLLCLRVQRPWHRFPDRDRESAAINRLLLTVELPGRVFIFSPARRHRSIARQLNRLTGSTIYRR